MIKEKKVKAIEYKGTIDSYNELIDNIFDAKNNHYYIWFVDEKGEITPKFTGIVHDALKGITYKPGNHYFVEIKND